MNVLFVHQSGELYGSDRVLLALVERLAQTSSVNPIVVLLAAGPLVGEFQKRGIEVHVRPMAKVQRSVFTPLGLIRFLKLAAQSMRQLDPVVAGRRVDAVHSNTIAVVSGAIWARVRGVHHVWHLHEIIVRPRLVAKALAWMVWALSDKVACISRMVQDNLVAHCPRIASLCIVVPNGIVCPAREIEPVRQDWRRQQGWQDAVVVGLVGRINAWKGQGVLVDAVARIVAEYPETPLRVAIVGSVFTGQEALLLRLQRQVADAGLAEHVRILGFTPDVWPIWCGIDIAVVPSTEPEPFGMVALEAMCAERAVIAAAHGGAVDIVVPGVTGLHCKPQDAADLGRCIQQLATDPALRRRLGQAGRHRVISHYGLDTQARAFEMLYAKT